jgi:hypothetical protein
VSDVAAIVAGMSDPVAAHFTLLHYGCGEPFWDAAVMARTLATKPVPCEAEARFMIEHWNDDDEPAS